tara:strand:- start:167 stop:334 length:168 start_codon:yes stop_codon:yes gene_type:complete
MITKCKKQKINNGLKTIILMTRDEITSSVPMNEENKDYQEILKWIDEGNTIQEAD